MKRIVGVLGSLLIGWATWAGDNEPIPTPGGVGIAREAAGAKVAFSGQLLSATSASGPWTLVSNVVSPLFQEATNSQRFYRSLASEGESIFSSDTVVTWTLTGPFQKHFNLAFAGTPDGFIPPVRQKPYFDGSIKMGSWERAIRLRVRGNSSLQECPFPKLKFKIDKTRRAGTPFFDAREIKIGTHCADGGRGNIGRLRDERATYREALAYEAMRILGFPGPRVRRAEIDFQDTSPFSGGPEVGWHVARHAMILDDIEVVAERMGGRALSDTEIATLPRGSFTDQSLIDLQFLHALFGNWDYAVPLDEGGYQNTEVVELPDQTHVAVAGDFDLSSWVTEVVRSAAPRDYRPELPAIEREAFFQIEQLQLRIASKLYLSASNRFSQKRVALEALVQKANVDEPGRTNVQRHLSAFFSALMPTRQ